MAHKDSVSIHRRAFGIAKECGTHDAERIAQELGIYLHYQDDFTDLLGMYVCMYRERHILLNSHMDPVLTRMVCAHEIGHDMLHRGRAGKHVMQEFELFDMRTSMEYEANAFAAHLLIDDEELCDLMRQGYDVVQLASAMGTNVNLMLVKFNEMNRMGSMFDLPYIPHADFLKDISLNEPRFGVKQSFLNI